MKYKYDLHVHTKEISPCGRLSIEYIIDKYMEEGYSGLVITDHMRRGYYRKCKKEDWIEKTKDFFYSYDRAIEYCKDKDFYIGLGMEISFKNDTNDFLVYGFTKNDFLENEWIIEMDLKEFYNKFKDKAIIIQAHPHRVKGSTLEDINYLHGIEIYNLNPRHNNNNDITNSIYLNNPSLIATGGSDVHEEEDLCTTGIYTDKKITSDKDLIKILENKEFKIIGMD
ncbi:MAG: PHP domain-containing protein [Peptostreptococcaceae bacterium]